MLSLQEISDRMEIQDLCYRYARIIDARDFDDLRTDVFTENAFIDYSVFAGSVGKMGRPDPLNESEWFPGAESFCASSLTGQGCRVVSCSQPNFYSFAGMDGRCVVERNFHMSLLHKQCNLSASQDHGLSSARIQFGNDAYVFGSGHL